jgi:hypothetical protein
MAIDIAVIEIEPTHLTALLTVASDITHSRRESTVRKNHRSDGIFRPAARIFWAWLVVENWKKYLLS